MLNPGCKHSYDRHNDVGNALANISGRVVMTVVFSFLDSRRNVNSR